MADQKKTNDALNVEEALTKSEAFLIKNKKIITAVVVAVVVIISAVVLFRNYYTLPREAKAQAALFLGEQLFEAGEYEQAINGDSIRFAGLLTVIEDFGGTKAANLAKAYTGLCYAQLGQFEEAIKWLDSFKGGSDLLITPALKAAKGNCYASLGQYAKAAQLLIEAADQAKSEALSPTYLIQAGQLLLEEGKADKAIATYEKAKAEYPGAYAVGDVDKYIEQAKAHK